LKIVPSTDYTDDKAGVKPRIIVRIGRKEEKYGNDIPFFNGV
jgi:hypothetical protein